MGGLFGFMLVALYLGGAWKFWTGFDRTFYTQSRLILTACWPVLLINASFRQNFMRALKG